MSKPTPLSAALKRLETGGCNATDQHYADVALICRALRLIEDEAEHTDDRDGQPVFEVQLDCIWLNAKKGFLTCVDKAMAVEDAGKEAE